MTHPLVKTWMLGFLLIIQWNLVLCLTKFVDTLLQRIQKSQKSYLSLKRRMWKTEHFLFQWTLWVLTQIYSKTRVYWNYLSQSIWKFQQRQPIPTHYLPEMIRLILNENFFHFSGKHYLQNHGTAVGTKTAVLIPLPIFFSVGTSFSFTETLRILRKSSSETAFEENNSNLEKKTLEGRRIPTILQGHTTSIFGKYLFERRFEI